MDHTQFSFYESIPFELFSKVYYREINNNFFFNIFLNFLKVKLNLEPYQMGIQIHLVFPYRIAFLNIIFARLIIYFLKVAFYLHIPYRGGESFLLFIITNSDNEKVVCFETGKCISAEIRDNDEERMLGLMFRDKIPEDRGMLFIFDEDVNYSFWMKNMKFNIDIIFIDQNKKIVSITKDAFPCNKPDNECELYPSKKPYKYVIEVISGFVDKYNIKEGQRVYFE